MSRVTPPKKLCTHMSFVCVHVHQYIHIFTTRNITAGIYKPMSLLFLGILAIVRLDYKVKYFLPRLDFLQDSSKWALEGTGNTGKSGAQPNNFSQTLMTCGASLISQGRGEAIVGPVSRLVPNFIPQESSQETVTLFFAKNG